MSPSTSENQSLIKTEVLTTTKEGAVGKIKTEVRTSLSSVKKAQALNMPARHTS